MLTRTAIYTMNSCFAPSTDEMNQVALIDARLSIEHRYMLTTSGAARSAIAPPLWLHFSKPEDPCTRFPSMSSLTLTSARERWGQKQAGSRGGTSAAATCWRDGGERGTRGIGIRLKSKLKVLHLFSLRARQSTLLQPLPVVYPPLPPLLKPNRSLKCN